MQDATENQFRLFNEIRRSLDVPHFALVGDHDVKDDPGATGFRRHVGDPYGSLSLGGFRFIRLNTQEFRPVGLSAEQIRWFGDEVDRALAVGERVVVFQHNYPYQIWENFAGPGIDDWRAIVQTRRIEAIVCGHTHYWQVANDGRNVSVATRSIGDPEGGPPGYTILYVRGDDLALAFRPVDESGPVVMVTHPRDRLLATSPRHIVRGPDRIIVRAWPAAEISAVRCRIDDGAWSDDAARWTKATGSVRCPEISWTRASTRSRWSRLHPAWVSASSDISFMVDPTGRYTAFPETRPVVRETRFC